MLRGTSEDVHITHCFAQRRGCVRVTLQCSLSLCNSNNVVLIFVLLFYVKMPSWKYWSSVKVSTETGKFLYKTQERGGLVVCALFHCVSSYNGIHHTPVLSTTTTTSFMSSCHLAGFKCNVRRGLATVAVLSSQPLYLHKAAWRTLR